MKPLCALAALLLSAPAWAENLNDTPPGPAIPPVSAVQAMDSPGPDGQYEVDVLVVYTKAYADTQDNVAASITRMNDHANAVFSNSGIPVHFRLVGINPYRGTDESVGFYDNRSVLALEPGIRAARDATGADLVVLMRSLGGANPDGICGLSSGFNNTEQSDPPANVNPDRDAFIVLGDRCGGDNGYAHELGHALAGGHEFKPGVQYWRPYSHATVCGDPVDGPLYASVMFSSNISMTGDDQLLPANLFSNPALIVGGKACGSAGIPGVEATQADNARAISEAAPYVAAYRASASARKSAAESRGGALPATTLLLLLSALLHRLQQKRPGSV